ncbi:MAG: hypothetical protein K2J67_08540, partial [Lachnospiraceae bacterium]|nr:hypothetical protein [Lachnospiraceae bacterium]
NKLDSVEDDITERMDMMGKKKGLAMFLVLALLSGSVSGMVTGKSLWKTGEAQTEEQVVPLAEEGSIPTGEGAQIATGGAGTEQGGASAAPTGESSAAPTGETSAVPTGSTSAAPTGSTSVAPAGSTSAVPTQTPASTTTAMATIVPSIAPTPITAPSTPLITGIKGGTKRVKLYWNKVSNADGYNVYYSTSMNGTYTKLKTITSGSTVKYVKKSLLQNQTYYFRVSAYRGSSTAQVESAMSVACSATTGKVAATSTAAKQYSTKAKFKKSNSYKKFAVLKNANYTRTFAMPGAKNTNVAGFASTKMVPQAACLAGGYILVSAYDKTGEDESVIYVINKSSKAYITTIVMPNKTKLNAMAYDGSNIWVTQKKKVSYFPYDAITQAVGSGNQFYELAAFTDTLPILTTGSYMTYYNNTLWVGAYNATATTNAYGYTLSKTASGKIALTQTYYMTMPNRTRAMSFDANGYLYLTRSAKKVSSTAGYMSQVKTFLPSITTPTKKGCIKKNSAIKKTKMPPMAMGSVVYGNFLYNVFASCQYAKCTYKVDRVVAVNLSKLK